MADVEGEAMLKTTASGPYRSAIRRMAAAVRSSASSQPIRCQPGIPIALRPRPLEWMSQPVRVIDQLGRGPTLRAERLAGGVRRIRLQGDEAAVLDNRDVAAACDAQSAIAINPLCVALSSHPSSPFSVGHQGRSVNS